MAHDSKHTRFKNKLTHEIRGDDHISVLKINFKNECHVKNFRANHKTWKRFGTHGAT